MTIKHLYPNSRPTLDLKFAKDKTLDPRITFSRASSGTYVDENGVIQSAASGAARFDHDPVTGESLGLLVEESRTNLVTYSEHFNNASWIKANVTITPNAATAPDGTFTADRLVETDQTSTFHTYKVVSATPGTYTASVYAKGDGSGRLLNITLQQNGVYRQSYFNLTTGVVSNVDANLTASIQALPDGWFRCSVTGTSSSSTTFFLYSAVTAGENSVYSSRAGNSSSGLYIWGAQAEAGSFPTSYIPTPATFTSRASTATYYDASGVIQTAAIDVARDDAYFPDENGVMQPAGLLLEGTATNYIDQSVDLTDTGTWTNYKFNTPTLNAGTAPDGTNTATSLVPNTENISRTFSCYNIATTFSGTLTVSVFAKANGYNQFKLNIDASSAGGAFSGNATFDLSTGTVTQGTSGVGKIEKFPNGWYRCSVTHTNTAQSFTVSPAISGLDNSGNSVFTGDGTSGYLLWGFQLEESPYPTSYIPTAGSTVTRAADISSSSTVTRATDVASITGANFSSWYNGSEGSFFIDMKRVPVAISGAFMEIYNNGPFLQDIGSSFIARIGKESNYVTLGSVTTPDYKLGISYTSNLNFSTTSNGNLVGTDVATSTNFNNLTEWHIGRGNNAYTSQWRNGPSTAHWKRLTYFPTRLSDAILQNLTT